MASSITPLPPPHNQLANMPPEMLVRVASFLTTPELGALRRSCKDIEMKLFVDFAREFFTKRQFLIEHESLEALVGISRHPALASRLCEVLISSAEYAPGPGLMCSRIQNGYVNRDMLLHTGLARDMLAEVFSNLPNLKTVGLRDYDGGGRIRDGPHALWRSWGWSLFSSPVCLYRRSDAVLFPMLLSALDQANARPSNIEVLTRNGLKLQTDAFHLPRNTTISSVLAGLKTLMLVIGDDKAPRLCADVEDIPLRLFLHHTTQLQSLRLNFEPQQMMGERIVDWLGRPFSVAATSAPLTDSPTPPVHLPSLTSLELGGITLSPACLIRTLAKLHLQSFSLHRINLQYPGRDSMGQDFWAQFLSQLSTSLSSSCQIRKIMIRMPSQKRRRMWFVPEGTNAANKAKAVRLHEIAFDSRYTGRTVHQWLRDMSELTFAPWIHTGPLQPPVVRTSDSA